MGGYKVDKGFNRKLKFYRILTKINNWIANIRNKENRKEFKKWFKL